MTDHVQQKEQKEHNEQDATDCISFFIRLLRLLIAAGLEGNSVWFPGCGSFAFRYKTPSRQPRQQNYK